jgi:hypothetical protein
MLVPSDQTSILTPLPRRPRGPVLRIDQAGRAEAARATKARNTLRMPVEMSELLRRPPLFGSGRGEPHLGDLSAQYCLSLLGAESWGLEFVKAKGVPDELPSPGDSERDVLLFSGGLDSLAMAAELATSDTPAALVSHDSGNYATQAALSALLPSLSKMPSPSGVLSASVHETSRLIRVGC